MPWESVDGEEPLERGRATIAIRGLHLALFRLGERWHAIESTCPHMGGPLGEGRLEGCQVICPWHGARFDVTTGAVLTPPAGRSVRSFRVLAEGGRLQVELPEPP